MTVVREHKCPIHSSAIAYIQEKEIARLGDKCAHVGQIVEGIEWIRFD